MPLRTVVVSEMQNPPLCPVRFTSPMSSTGVHRALPSGSFITFTMFFTIIPQRHGSKHRLDTPFFFTDRFLAFSTSNTSSTPFVIGYIECSMLQSSAMGHDGTDLHQMWSFVQSELAEYWGK